MSCQFSRKWYTFFFQMIAWFLYVYQFCLLAYFYIMLVVFLFRENFMLALYFILHVFSPNTIIICSPHAVHYAPIIYFVYRSSYFLIPFTHIPYSSTPLAPTSMFSVSLNFFSQFSFAFCLFFLGGGFHVKERSLDRFICMLPVLLFNVAG